MNEAIDFTQPTSGNGAEENRIVVLDAPAIAAPLPELSYLLSDIGLVGGPGPPHLVAGYGFSGKTLALQALAVSLASGRPVWGTYRCSEARVLHVDFEQGQRLTRWRYQRLARGMELDLPALGDALGLAVMPGIPLIAQNAQRWKELMEGRDLIIVDSLRAATPGLDENASGIRSAPDLLCEASERTQCRALVIHHARKPTEGAPEGGRFSIRGSSAIYDASDCAYIFSGNKGEPIRVAHERAKSHGDTVEDFALVIRDVELDDNPRAALTVRVHATKLIDDQREAAIRERHDAQAQKDGDAILRALGRQAPGVPTMELRNQLGLSGTRFQRALTHLGEAVGSREERRGKARAATCYYLREHLPDECE